MKARIGQSFAALLLAVVTLASNNALAQQAQIPSLQVCNETAVKGDGMVFLDQRQDAFHSGIFTIKIQLRCDPGGNGYPVGFVSMEIDMSDSSLVFLESEAFEQVTTTGKHTPTAYMNGRCRAYDEAGNPVEGCRFWLMVADNGREKTPDVVGFLAFDGKGNRISYGTGPLVKGDIFVAPTSF